MALQCAITGEVPKEPVISPKSGAVFEKTVIVKHLASAGTDPINDEPLSEDDLIAIQTPEFSVPRPPAATSLPALMRTFQNEWDAVMLESFELKRQNQQLRQELTQSLYQYDAATRVIARLVKERDQARQALASLQPHGVAVAAASATTAAPANAMETEEEAASDGLAPEIVGAIDATAAALSKDRKKRAKPEGLASVDQIRAMKQKSKQSGLHSSRSGAITAMAVHPTSGVVLTGGADKNAVLFNTVAEEVLFTLKGHSKKISAVALHTSQDLAVTASQDSTVAIWNTNDGTLSASIKDHTKTVTGVDIHPTGEYLLSCSEDMTWAISDLRTAQVLARVTDREASSGLTAIRSHPDGLILGVGAGDSSIRIWDLKAQSKAADFAGHAGAITALAFSENGYYLASASADATVKFWDLRKLKAFHTLEFHAGYEVNTVAFDHSGSYVAIGGSDVRAYVVKQWDELLRLEEHGKAVSGVGWNATATALYSAGADNAVITYA